VFELGQRSAARSGQAKLYKKQPSQAIDGSPEIFGRKVTNFFKKRVILTAPTVDREVCTSLATVDGLECSIDRKVCTSLATVNGVECSIDREVCTSLATVDGVESRIDRKVCTSLATVDGD
jgi:hypothetical protein